MKLVRWVPRQFAAAAVEGGLMSHHGSAMWVFDLEQSYRPGDGVTRNAVLIVFTLDDTAILNISTRDHIDFEDPSFGGEGAHPTAVIVKNNEPGAYGIGRMRQGITNLHTRTRYATKKEVAKALGLKEREVPDSRKPPTGWP